jgi:hypothetical protein
MPAERRFDLVSWNHRSQMTDDSFLMHQEGNNSEDRNPHSSFVNDGTAEVSPMD